MKAEIARRASATDVLLAYFRRYPNVWISARKCAELAGFCAWRTRISDARAIAERDDHATIVWNGQARTSAYMLRAKPLGRDAAMPTKQADLF